MKTLLTYVICFGFHVALFAQCTPPALTIENLPQAICIDAAPVPLVGYPNGGFFLINGNAVNFFDPAILGVGNHAVTYFLIYSPACPPVNLTQIVSVNPTLQIQAVNDTITCLNPLANLGINSSGPVSDFQWFGPSGFFSNEPAPGVQVPGDYLVIASNGGCTATENIVISENILPPSNSSAAGGTIACVSNDIQLFASCDVVNATYAWLGPVGFSSNLQNPVVNEAGQYLVNITDPQNGCSIPESVSVIAPPLPDVTSVVSGIITCKDPQVTLSASSTISNISFTWQGPNGTFTSAQNISVTQSGQYIVEAKDTTGCKNTSSILVVENKMIPSITVPFTDTLINCTVKSINLAVTSNLPFGTGAFNWLNQSQQSISVADQVNITEPATYTIAVTDIGNGCSAIEQISIGIDTTAPISFASISQPLCLNAQGQLSGLGSLTNGITQYKWISVEGNWLEMPNNAETAIESAGTYLLEITDSTNTCRATDTLVITPPLNFPENLYIEKSQPTCIGNNGSIVIVNNSSGIFSYNFKNNGFGNQVLFENLVPGDFTLQISESGGCIYDTIVEMLVPPVFDLDLVADSYNINQGDIASVQAIFNVPTIQIQDIVWKKFSEELCNGCFEISDTPLSFTIYTVNAITKDGCRASERISISVTRNLDFYVGNVFSPNEDGVNDILLPQFGNSIKSASGFRIYDRWGSLVYENNSLLPKANNEGWDGKIKGKLADVSVYIYQIELTYLDGRHEIVSGDVLLER